MHGAFHHAEGGSGEVGVDPRDRVLCHHDPEVSEVGIERGRQHTLLGDLAAQDDPTQALSVQQVLQRRLVADCMPSLDREQQSTAGSGVGLEFVPGTKAPDGCTGSGALALPAAARGANVTAADVARRATVVSDGPLLVEGSRGAGVPATEPWCEARCHAAAVERIDTSKAR